MGIIEIHRVNWILGCPPSVFSNQFGLDNATHYHLAAANANKALQGTHWMFRYPKTGTLKLCLRLIPLDFGPDAENTNGTRKRTDDLQRPQDDRSD
jgi:hypothetical protein